MRKNKAIAKSINKEESKFKLPLPLPHIVLIALISFYVIGLYISFSIATNYKYEAQITSMTTDQKIEYILTLDNEEFDDLLTNVTKDTAKELLQLYTAYNILQAQSTDNFTLE